MPDTLKKEKTYPVMEIFGPTIQGEGLVAGTQTHFIRFGLCDYKCVQCDSMHAVDPDYVSANANWLTVNQIVDAVLDLPRQCDWITLSGGNPAIHDLTIVVRILQNHGYKIAVETQGTLMPRWLHAVDVLTVSPKPPGMGEKFEPDKFGNFITEYQHHRGLNIKIPVFNALDLEFAADVYSEFHQYTIGKEHLCWFLSLGNPWPPSLDPTAKHPFQYQAGDTTTPDEQLTLALLKHYAVMFEDIANNESLSAYRFLPQLHTLVWGNARGK